MAKKYHYRDTNQKNPFFSFINKVFVFVLIAVIVGGGIYLFRDYILPDENTSSGSSNEGTTKIYVQNNNTTIDGKFNSAGTKEILVTNQKGEVIPGNRCDWAITRVSPEINNENLILIRDGMINWKSSLKPATYVVDGTVLYTENNQDILSTNFTVKIYIPLDGTIHEIPEEYLSITPEGYLTGIDPNYNLWELSESINELYLPERVTEILPSFHATSGVKEKIKKIVFQNTANHRYHGDLNFLNYEVLTEITLPAHVSSVTSINNSAFENCQKLETVHIPTTANYTAISSRAFAGCIALNQIVLSPSIELIDNEAFYDCKKLSEIDLSNVKTVGARAFTNNHRLEKVTFGKTINTTDNILPNEIFKGCENLRQIKSLDANAPANSEPVYLPGNALPNNILSIGENAFYQCGIETLSLEKVIIIQANAFTNSQINSIEIKQTLTQIGANAFKNCYSLTNINVEYPGGTFGNGWTSNTFTGVKVAYYNIVNAGSGNAMALQSLLISKALSLAQIDSDIVPFSSFILNDAKTAIIGFTDDFSLTQYNRLYIPRGFNIDWNVNFFDTERLDYEQNNPFDGLSIISIGSSTYTARPYVGGIKTANTLPFRVFKGLSSLTTVELGDEIDTIGEYAFSETGLTNINYDEATATNSLTTVHHIYNQAFFAAPIVGTVDLRNIQTLGNYAFAETNIAKVIWSNAINQTAVEAQSINANTVPAFVFNATTNLKEIRVYQPNPAPTPTVVTDLELPSNITVIGESAFSYTGIESAIIPARITAIERNAFCGSNHLSNLTIEPNPHNLIIKEAAFGEIAYANDIVSLALTVNINNENDFLNNLEQSNWDFTTFNNTAINSNTLHNNGTLSSTATFAALTKFVDFYEVINGTADGTNWPGYVNGTVTCNVNATDTAVQLELSPSFTANNLSFPKYVVYNQKTYPIYEITNFNQAHLSGYVILPNSLTKISGVALSTLNTNFTVNQVICNSLTLEEIGDYAFHKINSTALALNFKTPIKKFGNNNFSDSVNLTTISGINFGKIESYGTNFLTNLSANFTLSTDVVDLSKLTITTLPTSFNHLGKFNSKIIISDDVTTFSDNFLSDLPYFNKQFNLPNELAVIGANFLANCPAYNQELILTHFIDDGFGHLVETTEAAFNYLLTIGSGFLSNATGFMQNIKLPSSVTSIGNNFLFNTTGITDVFLSSVSYNAWGNTDPAGSLLKECEKATYDNYQTAPTNFNIYGTNASFFITKFARDHQQTGNHYYYRALKNANPV